MVIISKEELLELDIGPEFNIEEFIRNFDAFQKSFNRNVPKSLSWNFNSDVSLKRRMIVSPSASQANKIYWRDVIQSIMAAENFFYYRSDALVQSTIDCLKARNYLASAILARSLLEVSMWHVYHAVLFEKNLKSLKKTPKNTLIAANELQEYILKLIWGSNVKGIDDEIRQHKVFKIFDKVAKAHKEAGEHFKLEEAYDFLSEFVHPNVEGNNLFSAWDINANLKPQNEMKILLSKKQNGEKKNRVVPYVLGSLLWHSRSLPFTFDKYQESKKLIAKRFGLKLTHNPLFAR